MALVQLLRLVVGCAVATANVADVTLDDDDALLLQLQQTLINPRVINTVSGWPEDKTAILVDEAMCSDYQCGSGQVQSTTEGCDAATCSEEQCCVPEGMCQELTCDSGTVLTKSDGCGASVCLNEVCCSTEDTCQSISCLEGYVPIVDKVGCGKIQCEIGDCCAQKDTCQQFECGLGYLQHVGEDHECDGAQCLRGDCCDIEAICELHTCSVGYVHSGVTGGCAALSCTTEQCCVEAAKCEDHSCQEEGNVLSGTGGTCNAAHCSDTQCCVTQAFCSAHTCSGGTVKHREGGCSALQCTDEQCCAEQDVCTSVTCPTGFVADSTIDPESGCGKIQCEVADCCAQAGNCNLFNCGLGWVKHKADDDVCNAESCSKSDCCSPEATCPEYTCSPGMLKTSTQGCAATTCSDAKCCQSEGLCSDWTCGTGLSKLHEDGCGQATVCSDALCCVAQAIDCLPSSSCQGQKELCDARVELDFREALVKRNDLDGKGFLMGPVATMNGVSVDMLVTVDQTVGMSHNIRTMFRNEFLSAFVKRASWARLHFRLQDSATEDLVVMESLMFSFIDLDGITGGMFDNRDTPELTKWTRENNGAERVTSCDASRVILSPETDVVFTDLDDGCFQVEAVHDSLDMPTTLSTPLTQPQMAHTAVFVFEGKSTFTIDFQHAAPAGASSGRFILFAAKASFACEW